MRKQREEEVTAARENLQAEKAAAVAKEAALVEAADHELTRLVGSELDDMFE